MTSAKLFFAALCCCVAANAARAAQSTSSPSSTSRDCTVCHLEWVDSFAQPTAILLIDPYAAPVVAESLSCLGCHDGSVSDSRRMVWIEHGHSTGVIPSKGMKIPPQLPLEGGKLACRTCHTAHVSGFNESLKDAVFLRIRNEQDQLCKACHADKAGGPETGSHPIGSMKRPFPAALKGVGAHAGLRNDQVVCQSCHTAHGAKADQLLLMATDASQLCIPCHETMRPAMWDSTPGREHPRNPPIRQSARIQAIKDMRTVVGSGDRLVCLSCHKMHGGRAGKAMLADSLQDSAMCMRCHEEKRPMIASAHDLRKSAPAELNIRSEFVAQTGFCSACHTFHSYTRKPTSQPIDPSGLCVTCHSAGQVAAKHAGKSFHPIDVDSARLTSGIALPMPGSLDQPNKRAVACLTCHDPHDATHPHFLRTATSDKTCAACHATMAAALARPHDFSDRTDFRNASGKSPADAGRCGFCHSVHEARGPMMLAATDQPIRTMDDACGQCHRRGGMAEKFAVSRFNHPSGPTTKHTALKTAPEPTLPLFSADNHPDPSGGVACSSCHDVHSSEMESPVLLRLASATQLCAQCHPGEARMAHGPHDPLAVRTAAGATTSPTEAAKDKDLCLSCHRAHSNDPAKLLWTIAPTKDPALSDNACIACHRDQDWSAAATADHNGVTFHPRAIPQKSKIAQLNPALPLGRADAGAAILCKTCHDAHAAPDRASLVRIAAGQPSAALCAQCHDQAKDLTTSMHRAELMKPQPTGDHACSPCHSVHASIGISRRWLWSAKVLTSGRDESEQLCLGCHSAAGGATAPLVFRHPETNLKDLRQAPATRPGDLVDQFGKPGEFTCRTCHLPHGSGLTDSTSRALASGNRTEMLSVKTMLRPNVEREICAACHGIDALRRYLYFHDPAKRMAVKRMDERK